MTNGFSRFLRSVPPTLIVLALERVAQAGMPAVTLTEMTQLRFQTISFFLVTLLISSVIVRWIWNSLANDFRWMPKLSFRRAAGLVALWGLLFVIVLTMISGARELLTPGAWERNGATYRLKGDKGYAKDAEVSGAPKSDIESIEWSDSE